MIQSTAQFLWANQFWLAFVVMIALVAVVAVVEGRLHFERERAQRRKDRRNRIISSALREIERDEEARQHGCLLGLSRSHVAADKNEVVS